MKKLSLTLLGLALYSCTFAQFKYFFPDSNSYFSVSWMKFWFEGDTTIGDFQYKKVYMQSHDSIADFNKASYFAALREDTIAEKVYFRLPRDCDNDEYLLYDFDVNVGDTVSFYSLWNVWCPYIREHIVESIDSILIGDYYRKKINCYINGESWIEGIGSTNGIFFPGWFDVIERMDWTMLLCVHIDEELIYHTYYNTCYIRECGGGHINENKNKLLSFYVIPNPANSYITIKTTNDETLENSIIEFYDILGRKCLSTHCENSKIIDISSLKQGYYTVKLIQKNKYLKIQKFIKL